LELVSLRVREFVNRARSGRRRRRSCGFFFFAIPLVYHGDARTRHYGRTLEYSLLRQQQQQQQKEKDCGATVAGVLLRSFTMVGS
jgi:hypothetical protein